MSLLVDLMEEVMRRVKEALDAARARRTTAEIQPIKVVAEHYLLEDAIVEAWELDLLEYKVFSAAAAVFSQPAVDAAAAAFRALHEANRRSLDLQREELEKFQDLVQEAVQSLREDMLRWATTAVNLTALEGQVKSLQSRKGWTGSASNSYGGFAKARGENAASLNYAAIDLPRSLHTASLANATAADKVVVAIVQARRSLRQPVARFGDFHRTSSVESLLNKIRLELNDALDGELTRGPAEELNIAAAAKLKAAFMLP